MFDNIATDWLSCILHLNAAGLSFRHFLYYKYKYVYCIYNSNQSVFVFFQSHLNCCYNFPSIVIVFHIRTYNMYCKHSDLPDVLSPGLAVNLATSTILTANCCFDSRWIQRRTIEKGPLLNENR